MILVDFNGLVVGTIAAEKGTLDENLIRHIILNQLRQYAHKYKAEYGDMIICCEGRSWRKEIYPEYKYKRGTARQESKVDWDFVYKTLNMVLDEIRENVPYKVIQHPRAEADDIIGTLVEMTQEFGRWEDVMIISNDHDFKQLQKYDNVKQLSPKFKKLVVEKNPRKYLLEHVLKGDRGDGVPNVYSPDNTFTDDIRQKPMRQTFIDKVLEADNAEDVLSTEELRNFQRNRKLVDLSECPQEIKDDIIHQFDTVKAPPRSKLLNYLIDKRCKLLIECIEEF